MPCMIEEKVPDQAAQFAGSLSLPKTSFVFDERLYFLCNVTDEALKFARRGRSICIDLIVELGKRLAKPKSFLTFGCTRFRRHQKSKEKSMLGQNVCGKSRVGPRVRCRILVLVDRNNHRFLKRLFDLGAAAASVIKKSAPSPYFRHCLFHLKSSFLVGGCLTLLFSHMFPIYELVYNW